MRHVHETDRRAAAVLDRARIVAALGTNGDPAHSSDAVVDYLRRVGFEVIGVASGASQKEARPSLDEVSGSIDVVLVFQALPEADGAVLVRQALDHRAWALWFQPGTTVAPIARLAEREGLIVVTDRCIHHEHLDWIRRDAGHAQGRHLH